MNIAINNTTIDDAYTGSCTIIETAMAVAVSMTENLHKEEVRIGHNGLGFETVKAGDALFGLAAQWAAIDEAFDRGYRLDHLKEVVETLEWNGWKPVVEGPTNGRARATFEIHHRRWGAMRGVYSPIGVRY